MMLLGGLDGHAKGHIVMSMEHHLWRLGTLEGPNDESALGEEDGTALGPLVGPTYGP